MRQIVRRKTTANVARAKQKKEKNLELRRRDEIAEARQSGISVIELRQRKRDEVQTIIKNNGNIRPDWLYSSRWW